MSLAASVSIAETTALLQQMPCYRSYRTAAGAAEAERAFRHALGRMLKECGDNLLGLAEHRAPRLPADQEATIDALVDRIAAIFRRLDRDGTVFLVGNCDEVIAELEELDTRLILLVEEVITGVRALTRAPEWTHVFQSHAAVIIRDLSAFSEVTEERNYLLGLGWESELAWHQRRSQHG
ncbi:MAG: hypothetical protein R6X25_13515 [Candidatus Krumholzibacteriia bacterium]